MSDTIIRSAVFHDRQAISRMLAENRHHRHLDWQEPTNLINVPPFLVLERSGKITAALGCPPDPPGIAWVRLFVVKDAEDKRNAWEALWGKASGILPKYTTVAAICVVDWIKSLLESSDFTSHQEVVMLERNDNQSIDDERMPPHISIRPMLTRDLSDVEEVDRTAFPLLWQITSGILQRAHAQAYLASVAIDQGQITGYQISTRSSIGIHLARLAVHPKVQGTGVGQLLVKELIDQSIKRGIQHLTVNTQSDNATSLKLYQKLGFKETGERYPVYVYEIPDEKLIPD